MNTMLIKSSSFSTYLFAVLFIFVSSFLVFWFQPISCRKIHITNPMFPSNNLQWVLMKKKTRSNLVFFIDFFMQNFIFFLNTHTQQLDYYLDVMSIADREKTRFFLWSNLSLFAKEIKRRRRVRFFCIVTIFQ